MVKLSPRGEVIVVVFPVSHDLETNLRWATTDANHEVERRILNLFLERITKWPPWLKGVRHVMPYSREDMRGIDLVFTTTSGPVLVQVKSHVSGAKIFESAHRCDHQKIVTIVANCREGDRAIYGKAYRLVRKRHTELKDSKR